MDKCANCGSTLKTNGLSFLQDFAKGYCTLADNNLVCKHCVESAGYEMTLFDSKKINKMTLQQFKAKYDENGKYCSICYSPLHIKFVPNGYAEASDKKYVCDTCLKKMGYQVPLKMMDSMEIAMASIDALKRKYNQMNPPTYEEKGLLSPEKIESMLPQDAENLLQQIKINNSGLTMSGDEICVYKGVADAMHVKNVVVGSSHSGSGFGGAKVMGVRIRTYSGSTKSIRENVTERFSGIVYLTNKRIVMQAPKYSFTVKHENISSIQWYTDALAVYEDSKSNLIGSEDMLTISSIYALILKANEAKNTPTENKSISSVADEIREFKKLLDEGIISQEEFDAKKKQLLNL